MYNYTGIILEVYFIMKITSRGMKMDIELQMKHSAKSEICSARKSVLHFQVGNKLNTERLTDSVRYKIY